MSKEHKEALAVGRAEARAVRSYLDALEKHRPKRGRKRTAATIDARVALIDAELGTAESLRRLHLTQERLDLESEKESLSAAVNLSKLEADFIKHVAGYSTRKGISYKAWRKVGVPASVLARSDLKRTRGPNTKTSEK